jgi:hypothetical protein
MKIVINRCYGGFGLSDLAYEQLIKWGVPVRKYVEQERGKDGLYKPEPKNEGEIIFDRTLSPEDKFSSPNYLRLMGRYWETWVSENRTHPLLVKVVKKLGKKSWGRHAELKIIEIPEGVNYEINDYDGLESIHEKHNTWR